MNLHRPVAGHLAEAGEHRGRLPAVGGDDVEQPDLLAVAKRNMYLKPPVSRFISVD
jgi:hypothetical protein